MSADHTYLPRLLVEDYMRLLHGMIVFAWSGLFLVIATRAFVDYDSLFQWSGDDASWVFNVVLAEYGLNTLALTGVLFYRDWYERFPRASAQRLRWLLVAVVVWQGLHLFAAFHLTGSLGGPVLLLLPTLLMVALIVLPGVAGWVTAGYFLVGYLAVILLEQYAVIMPRGAWGQYFNLTGELSGLAQTALVVVLVVSLAFAIAIRQWLSPDKNSLGPAQRVDPGLGLYTRSFLQHRVAMELGRLRRQGGSAALLMIGLEQSDHKLMPALAKSLREQIRLSSDTPAIYQQDVLAVLLPTANQKVMESVVQRIVGGVARVGEGTHRLKSAVAIATHQTVDADSLMVSVESALQAAEPGGALVIVAG